MNYNELFSKIQENEADTAKVISLLKSGRLSTQPQPSVADSRDEIDPSEHKITKESYRPNKKVTRDVPDGKGGSKTQTKIEQVARISLSLQKLIVKRAVAFLFGNEPLLDTDEEFTPVIEILSKVFRDCKINTINRKTAREVMTFQEAAEWWWVDQSKEPNSRYGFETKNRIRCQIFSPNNGDVLYPYFDDSNDLIAFSREFSVTDSNNAETSYFETWTADFHYRWQKTENNFELCENFPRKNMIHKIPIVYAYQSKTEWADVQNLIERLEKLLSNFADTNDYHASPLLFAKGTITGFATKGENGKLLKGEGDASVQYVSWSQAPESVKTEVQMLLQMIYTLTQTPDISFESVKGMGAISGTALRLLFSDAHLKVQEKSEVFDEFLQRRINIILAYLATFNISDNNFTELCKKAVVTAEIQPYMLEDDTTKISQLMTATGNKAIMSRKTAVKTLGWVKDVEQEIENIDADESGSMMADLMTPTE